jgi:photosystem II stability/assembly factor-like uncharacterized protein
VGRSYLLLLVLAGVAYGQENNVAEEPLLVSWLEGRCVGCKTAAELGRIQFVSRNEAWAVGCNYPPPGTNGVGDFVVVHTTDGGRSWRETPETRQHAGDADGPPAFSFVDSMRGWIASWDPAEDPRMIQTRDSGQHWQSLPQKFLQKVRFFDDRRGCGTAVTKFLCTDDGGWTWTAAKIPHVRFIDQMLFLTRERGWIAGSDGKDFFVFRTVNGGRDWEESRTTPPKDVDKVRNLFFLNELRGWLITWHLNNDGAYMFSTTDGGKTWTPERDLSFQGQGKWAGPVGFVSAERGFIFVEEGKQHRVLYTSDGGTHWRSQALPGSVYDCQVFNGGLLCSSAPGFRVLDLHPK